MPSDPPQLKGFDTKSKILSEFRGFRQSQDVVVAGSFGFGLIAAIYLSI